MGTNTKNGMPGRYEASPATLADGQGSALLVDSSGRLVVVFPTGTSGIGKAEDSAHASGDIGVMMLAVRNDNDAALSGTDLDYTPVAVTAAGKLKVNGVFAEDTAHQTGDNGFFILTKRTDSAASTAGTDGDYAAMNSDSTGHVWMREGFAPVAEDNTNGVIAMARKYINSASYAASYTQDLGSNATANAKNSAGSVVVIRATNANAAVRYFQIHNKASAAGAGETALRSYIMPAGTATAPYVLELTQEDLGGPVVCSTGVTWAISTAAATYTAATASDHTVNLGYV